MSNCKVGKRESEDCNQIPDNTATWPITIASEEIEKQREEILAEPSDGVGQYAEVSVLDKQSD